MSSWFSRFKIAGTAVQDALLLEQYLTLRRQIPLMYALMFINVMCLGMATFGRVPFAMSVGFPTLISLATLVRTALWVHRRKISAPPPRDIVGYLRGTIIAAGVFSCLFGAWSLSLFTEVDPQRSVSIALFVFVGSISCCYCLQALPAAGQLVLLFGAMPLTVRLLLSGEWFQIGIGANFLIVAALILRTLSTSYAGFSEVLRSRSEMLAEQERARNAEQDAQRLAYLDPLTGLRNRRALGERLDALGADDRLALLILDLDLFKGVNDVHGHAAGDRLLEAVARRLTAIVEGCGAAYRLGGDEFAVTLAYREGEEDGASFLADRIVQEIAAPFPILGLSHYIGASVGISMFPRDAADRETLMRRADVALYKAKESGRSLYRVFEPGMDAELMRRSILERELRADLARDAFCPHYQPIVSLKTNRIIGFEMLARWERGDGAIVEPCQFIPIAEECGLVGDLMLRLLEHVCTDTLAWDDGITIAINVSPVQLKDPWLAQKILAVLTRKAFPTRRIALEITENALIAEPDRAKQTIESLKNQGMRLALDDFGTGFSSIQHLRMLPFDTLKIDRSFVENLDTDPEAYRMVAAMTQLAASLQLGVIAEGVESKPVLDLLRAMGCGAAQGYLFGAPMAAKEAGAMLRAGLPVDARMGEGAPA